MSLRLLFDQAAPHRTAPHRTMSVETAASVLAVIDMSVKVASFCCKYQREVTSARNEIQRLQLRIQDLVAVLEKILPLLQGPDGSRLSTTFGLTESVVRCRDELQNIETTLREKLKPRKTRKKAMRKIGLCALKWPFEREQVDQIVLYLDRHEQNIIAALHVDGMYVASCISFVHHP